MNDNNGCEIELGDPEKLLLFLYIKFEPLKIWVDTKGLPLTAVLCASFDGTEFMTATVGEKGDIERCFLDIDWVINDWGGDAELVKALKRRKQITLDELPELKAKYCVK